jgi:hypothetical protein
LMLALGAWSWGRIEGYLLADSIEYLEYARAMARHEQVRDASGVRALGWPALLAPLAGALERWNGGDLRALVPAGRLLVLLLGVALVRSCGRLGAALGGRNAGRFAALCAAVNPLLLLWSVVPLAGVPAALCVAQALERLIGSKDERRGWSGGLWLGAAAVLAFQTLVIAGALLLFLWVRDRLRPSRCLLRAGCGLSLGVLAQVLIEGLYNGSWGSQFSRYLLGHAAGIGSRALGLVGLTDWAGRLYRVGFDALGTPYPADKIPDLADTAMLSPATYYLTGLPTVIAWPLIVCLGAGVLAALARPRGRALVLLAVAGVSVGVMSFKGSKDTRLLLPILPLVLPLCALGFARLAGPLPARARGGLAALVVLCVGLLAVDQVRGRETRRFAGFWGAMELAQGENGPVPGELASAYDWAVFLRAAPPLDVVKLPHQLDRWSALGPNQRAADLAVMDGLEWLIVHFPLLVDHPDLAREVNRRFVVAGSFWDPRASGPLGPVLLLRRGGEDLGDAPRLLEVQADGDVAAHLERWGLGSPLGLSRQVRPDHTERLELLGARIERLPGTGPPWVEFHWLCRNPALADYALVQRMGRGNGMGPVEIHLPTLGILRTPRWPAGVILREGRPLLTPDAPSPRSSGDTDLWLGLATFGVDGAVTGRMDWDPPAEVREGLARVARVGRRSR